MIIQGLNQKIIYIQNKKLFMPVDNLAMAYYLFFLLVFDEHSDPSKIELPGIMHNILGANTNTTIITPNIIAHTIPIVSTILLTTEVIPLTTLDIASFKLNPFID